MSDRPTARVSLDTERTVGPISPLVFGGFAEHMGRCIYQGIYEPGSPQADARGIRRDVLAALRELNPRTLRYPGGNFLSGYRWLDGVGPRAQRPRRRELAWKSIETNQFGTDEFIDYCRELGSAPMLGVNLGTGDIAGAAALVEYCNAPQGSAYADMRAANGHPQPHDVRYWCLGNEMDGPWQIGHLDAQRYAEKAREAAKMMRWHDPELKLILCGSSGTTMPSYPEWDRVALEHCWDVADYLSLHYYASNADDDTPSFLAMSAQFESHIDTLAGLLRYVKAKHRSAHDVYLSWDEWNVWYKDRQMDGGWQEAPHLIEEVYNLEDALVVAQWMSVFLRRCDVLKIACLAQVVNVIAPILTTSAGLLKQSIFYPFALFSAHAAGSSLLPHVVAPQYETKRYGPMPLLDVSASHDEAIGQGAVFLVNRSQTEALETEVRWQGAAPAQVTGITQLSGADPKAANSFARPDVVAPRELAGGPVQAGSFTLSLPPLSFTVLRTR
ncbi:alpha-N-arabinofuranosidase [Oscillochloris sp. ZM17-4]|uniref:alpha-N-arabinofuranosidase n=1 Tax=Oscillochloris sp. ZM17-4 TaxID=2866714 RepID=UPI001C73D9A9|nr:alpha-N-arabinofuranosidase [Oscillochloris sp. ZM17-4]MBX0329007.1 alpha-N-arabinofuranosidase [Oscillochloris sp. ZM17-4]